MPLSNCWTRRMLCVSRRYSCVLASYGRCLYACGQRIEAMKGCCVSSGNGKMGEHTRRTMRMGSMSLVRPYNSAKRDFSVPRARPSTSDESQIGAGTATELPGRTSDPSSNCTDQSGAGAVPSVPSRSSVAAFGGRSTSDLSSMEETTAVSAVTAPIVAPAFLRSLTSSPECERPSGLVMRLEGWWRNVHADRRSSHIVHTLLSPLVMQRDLRRRHASQGRAALLALSGRRCGEEALLSMAAKSEKRRPVVWKMS